VDGVDGFDHTFFRTNPKEAAYMDPQQRILLELAYQAMDSSGYLRTHRRDNGDNIGCFIGASFNEYLDNTSAHAPTAYTSTGTIRAFLCGKISYYFGWSGPAEVIDTACSASLVAINRACRAIMGGECSMALAGGVNIMSGINNYMDLGKAGFLSPTGQCKPFDKGADGYCRADGAGLVVLKSLRHARADGDHILGVIPGVATNQGGLSPSITVPHSAAQMTLYRRILKQAGMKAEQVSYVECHGTGTQAGDPLEIASVREVFCGGDRQGHLNVGSLKGNIGHCETAAGVASLLKVLAMLQKQRIPPLASFKSLNPKIPALAPDKMAVAKQVEEWDAPLRAACVNSYGAAGSNSALLCVEMKRGIAGPVGHGGSTVQTCAWPIVISAASKDSLSRYCHALDAHIGKNPNLSLGDLSFTLAERKQRHRFQIVATVSELGSLRRMLTSRQLEASMIDVANTSRPVVMAFGGQSKQTVGLDRGLYESSPRLRAYIQECDNMLIAMGYSTILPAVFSSEPIADVVVLQTATFAVQYACAKSWTDAGVHVGAVIGHSFGELTALAFSGALSLRSGLKVVAARAKLMATKWGQERGTMLAIHAGRDVVDQVVRKVGSSELEVACYNAVASQVVVGSAAAVERAEALLASDAQFASVRSQRVDVSHGFHSKFTEPLLDELSTVAASLTFSEPKMALEMCVSDVDAKQSVGPSRIAQHTREPVYFVDAVRRIEARLGARCIWLEAGTDAPIIPMVKRAVSQPAEHTFLGMRFAGAKDVGQVLADVTASLWREGVAVSFWPCLGGPAESGLSHVYIPPYEFMRTSAWVVNVDRALEARADADTKHTVQPDPPRSLLVTEQQSGSLTFTVNIASKRFGDIVSGHAVRGRPLCPASMYMECAVMALQCHLGSRFDKTCALSFENLTFEHPLGVDLSRHVEVVLSDAGKPGLWRFQLRSTPKSSTTPRFSIHGRGKVRLGSPPQLQTFKHLVAECIEDVSNKRDTETLLSKRAYGLFSQVVTYAPLMRGIQSITMDGTRAVASIKVPTPHVAADDSSAITLCDTVSIDTFIQVVGLLINSSDACIPNHVFVATGVESATLSSACNFTAADTWTVYAVFRSTSETTATGDVFVMTTDGAMALNVMDVAFTRLPIATLEKLLDTANSSSLVKKEAVPKRRAAPAVPSRRAVPELEAADEHQTDSSSGSEDGIATPPGELDDSSLRKMIAMYTGVSVDAIATQSTMADLGVDSLAAVEFAEDLRSQFGKDIESMDLLSSNLNALSKLCLTSAPKPRLKSKLTKANVAQILPVLPVPASNDGRQCLVRIVSDACGAPISDIKDSHTLRDLGVDSLASVELSSDLENAFSTQISESDVHLDSTIAEICCYLGIGEASVDPSPAMPTPTSMVSSTHAALTAATTQGNTDMTRQRVLQIISDACGAPTEAMGDDELLRDLGVDSLAAVELKGELEDAFDVHLDDDLLDLSISETVKSCGGTIGPASLSSTPNRTAASPTLPSKTSDIKPPTAPANMGSPFDSLMLNESDYTAKARRCGFRDFGTMVAPRQDELMLAYMVEAIAELGVDLRALKEGAPLPPLIYRSKLAYDRLMQRLWVILEKHGLVNTISTSHHVRGPAKCPQSTSSELLLSMQKDFPAYRCEFSLMNLTGSQLGQCLAGKQDPIALMFKTQEAQAIMEDFYLNSPMLATATEMLVDTIIDTVSGSKVNNPINILEIGAGFGGTTRKLVQRLDCLGRSVSYTFTDISPTLVGRALKVFANQYPWLQFQTWNMEHTPPNALSAAGPFDIIIGTNCVHATQDRTSTLNRLKQLLHPSGFIVLSEVTEIVDWYDITYGLLDSWWSDKDGSYPLQSAEAWMKCFKNAGFAVASYSQGPTADLCIQRLLIASMRRDIEAPHRTPIQPAVETVVYKTADGVDIHADVFFPKQPLASAMPIGASL